MSQINKSIAFYGRKLSSAQVNYTTTERELLSIIETLKDFRYIILGQQSKVYTDHKNSTFKTFNTERVMRWRLILQEYNSDLIYSQGYKNIAPDAKSRLDIVDTPYPIKNNIKSINEHYGLEDENISHPTYYKPVMRYQ